MADIKLTRPAAGQNVVVPSAPDARMVLDFAADQVSIDRPQGSDSLYFRFDDGSSIELQNFYTQYNKDAIPSFEVDGQLIAGADFFNAFGPDLAPAAGPSASPTRSGRYSDFANAGLEDGINHLDGLDYRLGFGGATDPDLNPYPTITNSAPTLSTGGAPINMGITEAGVNQPHMAPITGSFTITDPDGDSITATVNMGGTSVAISGVTKVATDFGTLIITPSGGGANVTYQFTYEVNDNPVDPLFKQADPRTDGADSLAEGETHTEVITITLSDGMGHTVTQPINITVTGSNDAPDIRSFEDMTLKDDGHFAGTYATKDGTNAINSAENDRTGEGGIDGAHHLLHAVGSITAFDPDHNAVLTYGISASGSLKDAEGKENNASYTVEGYTPPADQTLQPTIQGCDTQIKTDYGTLYLNSSTGKYEFVVNPKSDATNHLAEGQTVTLSFSPTVTDEHGATDTEFGVMRNSGTPGGGANGINITIMGSNDLPVINGVNWGESVNTVTENNPSYTIGGIVDATDVDASEASTLRYGFFHPESKGSESGTMEQALFVVPEASTDGSLHYTLSTSEPDDHNFYGKLIIDPKTGEYSFTLKNDASCVQALDDDGDPGSSLGVTFPVVVKDDFGAFSKQDVSLTIKGENDVPQFLTTGDAKYEVTVKDTGVYAEGKQSATLNANENDATLAGGVGLGQHQIEASGKIVINDVDNGDNAHTAWGVVTTDDSNGKMGEKSTDLGTGATKTFYVLGDDTVTTNAPTGTDRNNYYGTLTVKDDGSYTFKANTTTDSPVDKLGETATHPITVKLYANDGHATTTSSLSITIKGSNEAPTVSSNSWTGHDDNNALGVTLNEAHDSTANQTVTGKFVAKDVDTGDTLHYGIATPDGGTTVHSTLYVVLENGVCKTVTDAPSAHTYSADSYVGEFNLKETGNSDAPTGSNYSFTLYNDSAAVQGLQEGVNKTASVTLVAQDNHGAYVTQNVSVTIKGANDTPTVTPPAAAAAAMSVVESGVHLEGNDYNAPFGGTPKSEAAANTFTVSDVDNGDNQTVSITIKDGAGKDVDATMHDDGKGKYTIDTPEGTFTLTAADPVAGTSGSSTTYTYSYALDNKRDATQSLNENDPPRNYTFTVSVTDRDGKGDTTHQDITLKITGTNDKPILQLGTGAGPLGTAAHETGENTAINGNFTVTDVDADGASLNGSGLTNHKISLSLESGSSTDTNKAPTPVVDSVANANDFDGDSSITTNYGVLTVKSDGTYSFTPTADFLDKGDQVNLKFNVTVTDRHGANDTKTISVTLNGENDGPAGGSTTPVALAVVESGDSHDGGANYYNYVRDASTTKNPNYMGKSTDGSSFTVKDVDTNDTQKVSLLLGDTKVTLDKNANGDLVYHGQYGDFIITPSGATSNADGSYSPTSVGNGVTYTYKYVLDDDKVNSLGADDDIDYKFKVVVTDSNRASTSQEVNVHVDTVNDIPLIGYSSTSVSEAGVKTGNTTFTDTGLASGQIPGGYKDGTYNPDNATNPLTFHVAGLTDGSDSWGVVAGTAGTHGGTQLALNITGTNEAGASISRAATLTIIGQSSVTTAGVVHQVVVTNYGVLDLNTATGSYTFNVQPTATMLQDLGISDANITTTILNNINHLAQGETLSFSFQATVTDPGNLTGTHMIGITIAGTNDKPALTLNYASTLVSHTSVIESDKIGYEQLEIMDAANDATGSGAATKLAYALGNATATDDDANAREYFGVVKGHVAEGSGTLADAHIANTALNTTQSNGTGASSKAVSVVGEYGTLKIDANGNYSYTVNQTMASAGGKINNLAAGEHLDDSFTILVKDEFGAWTTKPVTVRIDGVNDAPYLLNGSDISGTVKESGTGYTTTDPLTTHGNAEVQSSATVNNATVAGTNTIVGKFNVADDDSALAATTPFKFANGTAPDSTGWATYNTAYGEFQLNTTTGDYKFVLDNTLPAVQALQQGDSKPVSIPIVVTDAHNATLTFTYSLTVQGTNDKPALALSTVGLTVNDGDTTTYSPSGSVSVVDHDDSPQSMVFGIVGDTVKVTDDTTPPMGTTVHGSYGTFTVNPSSGAYQYTLADNVTAVTKLDAGETLTETFRVAVKDSHGAFDFKTVTVTINGKEDPTVLNTKWLTPDYAAIEEGVLPAAKDRTAETQYTKNTQSSVSSTGFIGAIDDDTTDQAALERGDSGSALHYFITVSGGTPVDINAGIKTGNGKLLVNTTHGQLEFTALTAAEQKVYHDAKSPAPAFKYTFTADDQNSEVNQLQSNGRSLHDDFTVSVAPNSTATPVATSKVTLTINGTNDRPEISFAPDDHDPSVAKSVTEDTGTTSGTLKVSDQEQTGGSSVDLSGGADKGHFTFSLVALSKDGHGKDKDPGRTGFDVNENNFNLSSDSTIMVGKYGWMQIDEKTGQYTYTRTSNLNALNAGEDVRDVFYVRVMDDHGAYSQIKALEVKLSGSNDPASGFTGTAIDAYEAGVAAQAGAAPGYLKFTKSDYLGANHATGGTMIAGTVHVADVDNDYTLAGKDTFALNLADGNKVTISGSTGVSVTDTCKVDGNTIQTAYGDFTLTTQGDDPNNPAGTYTFTPNNSDAINALKPGQVVTITVPVKAFSSTSANGHDTTADGYSGSVTVTLHGTNDVPVVAAAANLTNGYKQSFTSFLSDTSAEHNTFSEVKDTDSALRLTDDETATWRDGKSTGLTVRGTLNDANIEHDVDNTAQNADHRYTELSFFGVKSDGVTVTQNLEGKYGTLMLLPNGEYQYVLNPDSANYASLNGGMFGSDKTGTETFTIYVHDKDNAVATKPIQLVINVKGGYGCDGSLFHMDIDDSAGTVKEDTTYFAKGNIREGGWFSGKQDSTLHFTEHNGIDIADKDQSNIVTTQYGTISLLPDGRYTYVLNNDAQCVQELRYGERIDETFTVQNGPGDTAVITIHIQGTDDAPVLLADTSSLALHQDEAHAWNSTTAAGTFAIVDLDKGDATQLKITDVSANEQGEWKVQGKYGDYVITKSVNGTQATFSYKYELYNDILGNDYNGQYDDTVTLHIQGRDGGIIEKTLSVALTAENNAPTLAVSTNSVIEDDFGSGDLAHVVQAKGNLATATDTDIHLGSGTNDIPTYSLDSGASMAKGKYGTLFLESNGSYRYVLDNNNPTVQALSGNDKDKKNSTLTEVFNVKAFDGHDYSAPSTLSITVKGTNDAPTITLHQGSGVAGSGASLYVSETERHMTGNMPSVSGNAVAHDVDNGDTHTFSIADTAMYAHKDNNGAWVKCTLAEDPKATHIGDFSIDSYGNYTFTLAHTAEALAHGDKVVLTTTVTTTDGAGATASAPVQVTVSGANTAPEITSFTQSILLDEHPASGPYAAPVLAGQAIASDVDGNAEIKSYYIQTTSGSLVKELSNDYGTLKIDPATGKYTFALNETGEKLLQSLGEGEALSKAEKFTFDFNIIVKDQYNASSEPQTLHIDLHGINDAPVFSSSAYTATVKESGVQNNGNTPMAGTLSASGQVVSIDHDARDTSTYSIDGGGELATAANVGGETYDYSKTTSYGTLYLNSSTGKYTFVLDDSPNGAADKMPSGTSKTESFGITVKDNHDATAKAAISVTINGTNDAPVLTAPTALTVTEDTSQTASGTLTSADVDTSSHSYSIVNAAVGQSYVTNDDGSYTNGPAAIYTPPVGASSMIGTYGTLTIAANGTYRYTLNNSSTAVQGLGLNADGTPKTLQDTFYLMVKDSNKAFDIKPVSITINGTNDLPEVAALAAVTLDAAGLVPHADVTTSLTAAQDIDGDKLTYKVGEHGSPFTNDGTGTVADIQGEFGTLSFTPHSGADGHDHFTYKLDTSEEGLIKLAAAHAEGSSLQDTFGYSVTDGHSASQNSGPLTVNLAHTSPIYSDSDGHSTGTIGDPAASTGHLLFGGDQNDTINGGTGNDIISGGMGDDYLFGGAGNDHLYGGAGNDHLYGGAGNDHLYGGAGNDHLYGGAGNDYLYGGAGNDFLDGGTSLYNATTNPTGGNLLDGGAGNDVLVYHQGDTINGGDGTDVLLVNSKDTTSVDELFNAKTSSIEVIIKGEGVNNLTDMKALADKGITFNAYNQVELDHSKGWEHQASATGDTHSVWTNESAGLTVTTVTNEDPAGVAAQTILLTNNS